jgi:hypothetical protein
MQHYGDIMFTDAVQAEQARRGSRTAYEKMTARPAPDALGEPEAQFIEARDSFYMATVSETGWPYIQHRGGPTGFLHVLGPTTIGFADYRGNRQYVSKGNLDGDDRVSLILVDYPARARLKLAGRAKVTEASEAPELAERLHAEGAGHVERLFVIEVEAFDWNCPQFITPRFTQDEVAGAIEGRHRALADENAELRARVRALEELAAQP